MPFLDALNQYDDGRDLSDYDFNQDGFNSPSDDENKRKLAYRHRVIANKYMQSLPNVLDQEMTKLWNELYDLTDEYTDRWLSSARALLDGSGRQDDLTTCLTPAGGIGNNNDTTSKHINHKCIGDFRIIDTQPYKVFTFST